MRDGLNQTEIEREREKEGRITRLKERWTETEGMLLFQNPQETPEFRSLELTQHQRNWERYELSVRGGSRPGRADDVDY